MDALRSLEISSAPFVQRTPDVCRLSQRLAG